MESIDKRMFTDASFLAEVERVKSDLIEDHIHGTLEPGEMASFKEHFLASPVNRRKYRFMLALNEHAVEHAAKRVEPAATATGSRGVFWNDLFSRASMRYATVFLVLIAGGFLTWSYISRNSDINNGLLALNSAFTEERPLESRFSSMDYAPRPVTRGGGVGANSRINAEDNTTAGLLLMRAVRNNPSPEAYRALGTFFASQHDLDNALDQFNKGLEFGPSDPKFFADYGAILLEAAKNGKNDTAETRSRKLDNSVSQIDKALKLNSGFLPALFNKALCLQEMNSPSAAREAWQNYLNKDPSSKWAEEARKYLKLLDNKNIGAKSPPQVLDDFMQAYEQGDKNLAWKIAGESKEMITGTMVSEQLTRGILSADAQEAPKDANRTLSALKFLGQLEKENSQDIFFSDLAEYYSGADRDQRAKLARAQTLTSEAYDLCSKVKFSEALEKFKQSRELFTAAGDPLEAAKTNYWISYCLAESKLPESTEVSDSLVSYSRDKSYKWLLGQALTQTGSNYLRQSKFSAALRTSKEALKIAQETSDSYNRQKASAQLAQIYAQLNDPAEALANSQNSLEKTDVYFNSPRQTWRNYMAAALVSYRLGLGETSVVYAREGIHLNNENIKDPGMAHYSFSLLAAAYKAIGDYNDALKAADDSIDLTSSLSSPDTQNRLLALSLVQKAEAERLLKNCPAAIEHYGQAIEINNSLKRDRILENYNALRGRLLCYESLGQNEKISAELTSVIRLAEDLRSQIEEDEAKTSFFAEEQNIYEFAAKQALKNNDFETAFNYVEDGKARSLLDNLRRADGTASVGSQNVLTLTDIKSRVPSEAQVVQYAVLPDKVLIWVIDKTGLHYAESNVTSDKLESLVSEYMRAASSANSAGGQLNETSQELYELLLKPVKPFLHNAENNDVVIIPDKILYFLPFGALRTPEGKYVIEDTQISYAPSGTLFVMLSEQAAIRAKAKGDESFLGIGNPAFDRKENPDLSNLTAAEDEINKSSSFYRPNVKTFIRDSAEKENLLAALPNADVFHFAGHYFANAISPRTSKLILAAGDRATDGDLSVMEIEKLKLTRTRLVVLSACNTALENYYHGEGALGVARTFFTAGVPTVVASRWEVESTASAELMTLFHHYRKDRKLSNAAALRAAQLEMINGENKNLNSPYFWAAFAVIGGIEKP